MDSANPTSVEPKSETFVAAGKLPPWEIADLPAPPAWGLVNLFRVIGPGAILLGTTIGGGEWLVGPTIVVKYGLTLLWVTTVAIVFQTLLNLELVRYTLGYAKSFPEVSSVRLRSRFRLTSLLSICILPYINPAPS